MRESVTQKNITQEDIKEAESLEMDVKTMLKLIDLIFLCRDEHKDIPS
ncbi:MAG: hypothetical protein MJZ12_00575 [Prevotella sp.]|nr:hypothetical protein [Prevotella sp.]